MHITHEWHLTSYICFCYCPCSLSKQKVGWSDVSVGKGFCCHAWRIDLIERGGGGKERRQRENKKIHSFLTLLVILILVKSHYPNSLSYEQNGLFIKFQWISSSRVFSSFIPVIELTTERRIVGGLISSFKMLDSVASGNPLSNISSKSSYTMTTLSLIAASEHSPK